MPVTFQSEKASEKSSKEKVKMEEMGKMKDSFSEKWVENYTKTAEYLNSFAKSLMEDCIQYDVSWDEDTGTVLVSLNGEYANNHIYVQFLGKTVTISAKGKWKSSAEHLVQYDFTKYTLLKGNFEPDFQDNKVYITFEHVMYLHANPTEFSMYLLQMIKKFDCELREFVSRYSLYSDEQLRLPPTPFMITATI